MARIAGWLRGNVDGVVALLLAVCIAILGAVDVLGTGATNNAILLVLAVLATTLLRDRTTANTVEHDVRELKAGQSELRHELAGARDALEQMSMIRILATQEVGPALAEARRDTDRWYFKGGTGTYIRAVTLPECVAMARREKRELTVRLEIIDPTNEVVCGNYARFRHSLSHGPDGIGELWTLDRTRKESFATVLAACWYRQRYELLNVEVGLSTVMSTFRWDLSSKHLIVTQEDSRTPAMLIERGKVFYDRFRTELHTSLEQVRRLPITKAALAVPLSNEPTIDQVHRLFDELELPIPNSFTDRDMADIVRRAIRPRNPYQT
ncbi:MAG TPA: hypothetical protein VLJ59_13650 [Mycobacteriales bacterium]|nr:hypothetical protein [Mycobacteriales bacterium]